MIVAQKKHYFYLLWPYMYLVTILGIFRTLLIENIESQKVFEHWNDQSHHGFTLNINLSWAQFICLLGVTFLGKIVKGVTPATSSRQTPPSKFPVSVLAQGKCDTPPCQMLQPQPTGHRTKWTALHSWNEVSFSNSKTPYVCHQLTSGRHFNCTLLLWFTRRSSSSNRRPIQGTYRWA